MDTQVVSSVSPAEMLASHSSRQVAAPAATSSSGPKVVPAEWAQWRHDAAHTGFNPAENMIDICNARTLSQVWARPLKEGFDPNGGGIYGDILVFGEALYARTGMGYVSKLGLDGTIIWTYPGDSWVIASLAVATPPGSSTPLVFYAKLVGKSPGVYALKDTGKGAEQAWHYASGSYVASPTVADGTVYVADSAAGVLTALDAGTGRPNWSVTPSSKPVPKGGYVINGSPAVAGGHVYIGDTHGDFYALTANKGVTAWHFAAGGWISDSPALEAGTVFFTSQFTDSNGQVSAICFALDAATGQQRWKSKPLTPANVQPYYTSSVALAYGLVYVPTGGGVIALSQHTGEQVWENAGSSPSLGSSSVTVANGLVFTSLMGGAEGPGGFAVYDAHTGGQLVNRPSDAPNDVYAAPSVAGGRMYLGTGSGTLGSVLAYSPK